VRLDDRIDRAALFAETAEDALGQVDVVARRAAGVVRARFRLDGDGERRAHRFAQLAGDAALFAVFIAAQRVQPAEARRNRRLLFRELHGDLALERIASGQREALEQFGEEEGLEKKLNELRSWLVHPPFISRCSTAT
jgi:hypothetical protein